MKRFRGKVKAVVQETLQNEDEWEELQPDLSMNPKDPINQHILVWWPKFKNWYHGKVVGQRGKRHLVHYFDRSSETPEDEDEIYEEKLLGYKNPYKWKLLKKIDAQGRALEEGGESVTP